MRVIDKKLCAAEFREAGNLPQAGGQSVGKPEVFFTPAEPIIGHSKTAFSSVHGRLKRDS
jgi:hypothetical protein